MNRMVSWLAPILSLLAIAGRAAADPEDAFNYVAGTQTFGPAYQFTDQARLVETAEAMRALGASVIKFELSARYAGPRGNVSAPNPAVRSLADLARSEPSHRRVLDLPFAFYVLWAHAFGYHETQWRNGLGADDADREYRQMYDLVHHLLVTYQGTGKTFFLGLLGRRRLAAPECCALS